MKRGRALRRRYGRGRSPAGYPRIHIVISTGVTAFRAATGDNYAIEARMQSDVGGAWALIGLRFSPTIELAREISHEIGDSVTKEYRPRTPVVISEGSRQFGDFGETPAPVGAL